MDYRLLGRSGLKVSALSMGTMTLGIADASQPVSSVGLKDARRHIDLCLGQHLQRDRLHRLGLDERDAHVQRTPAMLARALHEPEPVDELLRQAFDDLIFLLSQESQHGQPDGHVATQKTAAFYQTNLQTVLCRSESGGEAGRAAADDEHVVVGADRDGLRGFVNYSGVDVLHNCIR